MQGFPRPEAVPPEPPITTEPTIPHNLALFRLQGFVGRRAELIQLHEWLTGGDDLPAIAIGGEQGSGKTTLATAVAWTYIRDFPDGVVRVGAAGVTSFRLYDVVRTMDSVFGTTMTRLSEERWGLSILEQLYRRRRLLILDELSGTSEQELATLVHIIAHLHESGGHSRVLFIDRNLSPAIAELCQHQLITLEGLAPAELPQFIQRLSPPQVQETALAHVDELYDLTHGRPYPLRLILGLMLDYPWGELRELLQSTVQPDGRCSTPELVAFAAENFAAIQPHAGPLLDRLVTAAGGASLAALEELFWPGLGAPAELEPTVAALEARALLDRDIYQQRLVMHPTLRRYLDQNAAILGEDWERRHAHYYSKIVEQYQVLPLERWSQIDPEWGNIYQGADWCAARVERLWQHPPLELFADPKADTQILVLPPEAKLWLEDLRLARAYGMALAHYAFWRHPPGIQKWLAAGAAAALALTDVRDYAWLQMNMGRQYFFTGQVEEAIEWLKRAAAIFDSRDLLTELAYAFTDLGTSYRVLDRSRLALNYFRAAFECVAQLGDQRGLATAYTNLGSAHYGLNEFERALQLYRKALRIALRLSNNQQIASAYNSMGLAMEGLERLQEAEQAYTQALALFRSINDPLGISTCYNNLGSVTYAQGNFAQAVKWYELDLALADERNAWTDMAATLHNLGHVAAEQRAWDQAEAYFRQSRDLYAAFNLVEYVEEEEEMIEFVRANRVLTEP
ncbi:MAG: tetratricopeptide repeat protein [Caldilineaceae bacterium]|nr:tetratricopeptide repeat protein [Caldilineaceae bacterium]